MYSRYNQRLFFMVSRPDGPRSLRGGDVFLGKDIHRPMMPANDNQHRVSAWGISLVVHGVAVAAAIAFSTQVKPVLQQEIFHWDVALLDGAKTDSRPERAEPVVERTKMPARVSPQQPRTVVREMSSSVVRQETKKEEGKEPEPAVREIARETPEMVEPVATAQPYVAPAPAAVQAIPAPRSEPLATANATPSVESVPEVSSESSGTAAVHEQPPLVTSVSPPRVANKADYAWLADSLGRRLAALTRYPSSARLNGWEGRVVLRAIIRADGHLLDVKVHKSSGHDALDRAALETIKLACPLHMKHALDSTEIAIYVPIVYSLAG